MSDESADDRESTSEYVASLSRELRRERWRSLAGCVLGGALLLAVIGAALGSTDDWDGSGWPARLGFIAACALGGAVAGFRFWVSDRDD